jgi:hypothetical protein
MASTTVERTSGNEALQSRAEIADLVHRYALNIRNGNAAACGALFTHDIEFIVRQMDPRQRELVAVRSHDRGLEEVLAHIAAPLANISLCPMIHNLLIDIEGDRAFATSIMENRTFPPMRPMIGEYHDDFRFEGRWLFSKRVYTLFVQPDPPAA